MNLPIINNLTSIERGYLLGLFIGDGYASYHVKSRHYNVSFTLNSVKDGDIQNHFLSLFKKMNLVYCIVKDKRFNANYIRVNSKDFFMYIKEINERFSKGYSYFDKEFLLGVVSGFIDAEGCVYNGTILITQKNEEIIHKMKKILIIFDVNCTLKQRKNYPDGLIWRGLISTKFKHLQHCSQKVLRAYKSSDLDKK
ncbi:MAG: LAGLIDADG family homing endonuclease [Nanoarchaeota archaeon]